MNIGLLHGAGSNDKALVPQVINTPVLNVQGATLTAGLPCCYTNLAASADGAQVVLPVATCQAMFAGIVLKSIPNNGIGMVRAFGVHNSVAIFATGTSVTVAIDAILGVGVAGSLGVNSTGLVGVSRGGFVIAVAAIGAAINSPGGYVKGFVKAI